MWTTCALLAAAAGQAGGDGLRERPLDLTEPNGVVPIGYVSPYYEEPVAGSAFDPAGTVEHAQYLPTAPNAGTPSPTLPTFEPPVADPPPTWWAETKPQWLKGGRGTLSYVPTSGEDLGWTALDVQSTFVAPVPLLSVTPRVNLRWLDGPASLTADPADRPNGPADVPGMLLAASVEARWFQPLSERWMLDFAVSPGLYTDGENTGSDALRITGRALAFYKWHEAVRVAFGAVYLDREDINVIPAVGLMVFPSHDTRIELLFPRPRLAQRIFNENGVERWAYVAGEFGGGQWAITRADGSDDTLRIRDFRFLAGLEQKDACGAGWVVEGGFLFGRELEYDSGVGDAELDLTSLVRAGVTF